MLVGEASPLHASLCRLSTGDRPLFATAFLAIAFSWLIPNHYPPWTSFYNEAAMALGLMLLLIAVGPSLVQRRHRVPHSVWFLVAVALIPWLQLGAGTLVYSGDAVVASTYVGALAVAILVGSAWTFHGDVRVPLLLSWAALLAGCVSTVIALTQAFDVFSWGLWAEWA